MNENKRTVAFMCNSPFVMEGMILMPMKSKRPCRYPDCPNLTDGRYCDEHKALYTERPSASKRGYGSKWQRVSKAYLRKHPLCVKCMKNGRFVTATVVDHIIPHRNNYALMWSESNWQSLCKPCHDKKTRNEDSNPLYSY